MNVREAIQNLMELQDAHGGDLPLVDPDGDIIEFIFLSGTDINSAFPQSVILVDYVHD